MKLSKKELTVYYTKLFKIRETELKIAKEYSKQEMRCPVHLSIGQEAPSAAVNLELNIVDSECDHREMTFPTTSNSLLLSNLVEESTTNIPMPLYSKNCSTDSECA